LSAVHALPGQELTIVGSFGSTPGLVTFGERPNPLGFAPVSKQASIVHWSDEEIIVTVPAMSPGKAGYPHTYHPVYVSVGGEHTASADFYVDPIAVNPESGSLFPFATNGAVTFADGVYTSTGTYGVEIPSCDGVLYDGVTFEAASGVIPGNAGGVLTLGQNSRTVRNVTFLDSTIRGNTGPGASGIYDEGVNAVKMIRYVDNVTFAGTLFESCSRMALETWTGGVQSIVNNALRGCIFEPTGSLAISLVGGGNYQSKWLLDGCLFKGGNWGTINSRWGGMLELRQAYVEVRDTMYWRAARGYFNLGGFGVGVPTNWYFRNVNVDVNQAAPGAPTGRLSGCNLIATSAHRAQTSPYAPNLAQACESTLWDDCHFNTGSAATAYLNSGSGGVWSVGGYNLNEECGFSHNRFPNSTISGDTYYRPTRGYWIHDAATCLDNAMPSESAA
jgi:hypothetical protein